MPSLEIASGIPVTAFIIVGFLIVNGIMLVKKLPARALVGWNLVLVG